MPLELGVEGTQAPHFQWWCRTYLEHSVDHWAGLPLELEPFQMDFMSEALTVDGRGLYVYRSITLVLPRKNGKTALLAAYALYRLLNDDGMPEILLAAASDKQAGRLFNAVVNYVRRSPHLREQLVLREYIGEIARKDGNGKILRMASNPEAAHGYNPSLVIADELAQWNKPGQRSTWEALVSGDGGRDAPQTFAITTAGKAHERHKGILGLILAGNEERGDVEKPHAALTISRNHEGKSLVYNYSAPTKDKFDTAKIKQANPASWITEAFLATKANDPQVTTAAFMQLYGCVWTDVYSAWIESAAWDALMVPNLDIPEGADVWVGIDGAITNDCTAVGIAWRIPSVEPDEDSDTDYEDMSYRIGVKAHVWSPLKDSEAHEYVESGYIDNRLLVPWLLELKRSYNVREIAYDERYLTTVAQMLAEAGFMVVPAWSDYRLQAMAWQGLRDGVDTGRLAHDGDPVLAAHATAAMATLTDQGFKIKKISQRRKIDALVAIAMAAWRCSSGVEVQPWVGEIDW